jgi:hypothetical protein
MDRKPQEPHRQAVTDYAERSTLRPRRLRLTTVLAVAEDLSLWGLPVRLDESLRPGEWRIHG